ncbi:MAG: FmdB family transcriptional regulator [Opitutaceae bacterium]|jgi:putative FmdB family regulatory protein|nr:FmdB family transcriptional regulator [Opitutaceae bacterium]|tara:strand:+ start:468 stop:731 length:264 start_codon:yes stop_codon:yes gene_type:complete
MPTYDYICSKCGHELEVFQSMKDERLKKCPTCKKMGLKRQIGTGGGLIFKGSGFYETDFKTRKGTPDKESKPAESKPAKTETKAATK